MAEPSKATVAPPSVDVQDPLPESSFFYRRLFSFVFIALCLVGIWFFTGDIAAVARNGSETAIDGLVGIVRLLIYLVALALTYYMLAPSAEQLALIIQTAKSLREGVSMRSTATVATPAGSATTTTTAGPAALPVSPAPAPVAPPIVLEPDVAPTSTVR